MRVYGITGWKNAGKTTLTERLVAEFTARGWRVSTVKHAHHQVDLDQPGRDSHRHRVAGAEQVILATPNRWALMQELRGAPEPDLDMLLGQLAPVDLVLVEGYKSTPHPKIEVWRSTLGRAPIAEGNLAIRALATDGGAPDLGLPVLDLNDIPAIADFIVAATEVSE